MCDVYSKQESRASILATEAHTNFAGKNLPTTLSKDEKSGGTQIQPTKEKNEWIALPMQFRARMLL